MPHSRADHVRLPRIKYNVSLMKLKKKILEIITTEGVQSKLKITLLFKPETG